MPIHSSNTPLHPMRQLPHHLPIRLRHSTLTSPLPRLAPPLRTTAPCSPRPRHPRPLRLTPTTTHLPRPNHSHTYAPNHHLITTGPSYLHWIRYQNTRCPSHSCLPCRSTDDAHWTYFPWPSFFSSRNDLDYVDTITIAELCFILFFVSKSINIHEEI